MNDFSHETDYTNSDYLLNSCKFNGTACRTATTIYDFSGTELQAKNQPKTTANEKPQKMTARVQWTKIAAKRAKRTNSFRGVVSRSRDGVYAAIPEGKQTH